MAAENKSSRKESKKAGHFDKKRIKHDPSAESARAKFGKNSPS